MMHMRLMITATLLCVCLTTAGGCKKGSQPAEKPEAVKQTIAMDQPAPAAGQQPPAAEAGKAAPETASAKPAATEQPAPAASPAPEVAAGQTEAAPAPEAAAEATAAEPPVEAADQEEAPAEGDTPADGEIPAEPEVVLDLADIEADGMADETAETRAEEEAIFNPFTPLFRKDDKTDTIMETDSQQQRAFLTPLERISLGQLQLAGVIRAASGNRAIVTDATGKGYVIKKGTYIGLNAGRVEDIVEDRVVVVEMIGGRKSVTELKLQKPAGE